MFAQHVHILKGVTRPNSEKCPANDKGVFHYALISMQIWSKFVIKTLSYFIILQKITMLLIELFEIKCKLCIINSISYENKDRYVVVMGSSAEILFVRFFLHKKKIRCTLILFHGFVKIVINIDWKFRVSFTFCVYIYIIALKKNAVMPVEGISCTNNYHKYFHSW